MKRATTYEKFPHRDSQITIKSFYDYSTTRIHWHETIEILYYMDNRAAVSCNLSEHRAERGDIVFVNSNELHMATHRESPSTYYCFHLRPDFFSNFMNGKYVAFENIIRDDNCSHCLDMVLKCYNSGDFNKEIVMKKYMYKFLEILTEKYVREVLDEEEYKKNFKVYDKFNEIVIYIEQHYDEELCVEFMANEFFMSKSYFSSLFHKNAGVSVMKYVNTVRINHAKAYLDNDSMSVGQVANAVGFDDINYFSRKFKKLVGMTPTEYKNR